MGSFIYDEIFHISNVFFNDNLEPVSMCNKCMGGQAPEIEYVTAESVDESHPCDTILRTVHPSYFQALIKNWHAGNGSQNR